MSDTERKPLPVDPMHRRQITWQVFVPLALGTVGVLAMAVLAVISASGKAGTIQALSSTVTIFMVVPLCLGGLIMLGILAAAIFGMSRLLGVSTPYLRAAQKYAATAGVYAQIALDKLTNPILNVHGKRAAWSAFWKNLFPHQEK